MDGSLPLQEAVAALLRAHRAARETLDAQPMPSDFGPERYVVEHHQRRVHLCLDRIEDLLVDLVDLCGE